MIRFRLFLCAVSCLFLITPWLTQAGDIDSPAPPDDPAGAMFTLQAIFDRLNDGSVGAIRGVGFVEPTTGPAASASMNLNDIMGVAPLPDLINGATPAQVRQGRTFWGLDTNAVWGPATGSMPDSSTGLLTPGVAAQAIPAGFHDGAGSVAGDVDLTAGNITAGSNIFGVAGSAIVAAGTATASQVLSGATFSNTGGAATGSMANIGRQAITPGTASQGIQLGFHDGTGKVVGDAALTSGNIHAGVTIFGVAGNDNVVNTSTGDALAGDIATGKKAWVDGVEVTGAVAPSFPAPVSETGQTTCSNASGSVIACAGTGQDGDLRPGVAWPNPRFTNNGDGTVTDNLTGLIWLQNAQCFSNRTWTTALSDANTLADGACTLSDGSVPGDWRLPSVKELRSLSDFQFFDPALSNALGTGQWTPGDPFTNVSNSFYWSSSSRAASLGDAWWVIHGTGNSATAIKSSVKIAWPVREP